MIYLIEAADAAVATLVTPFRSTPLAFFFSLIRPPVRFCLSASLYQYLFVDNQRLTTCPFVTDFSVFVQPMTMMTDDDRRVRYHFW